MPFLDLAQTPSELILDLIQQVLGLNLPHGIENSLESKLDAAFKAFVRNDVTAGVNKVNGFINAVRAQRGKHIPTAAANSLIAAALQIVEALRD